MRGRVRARVTAVCVALLLGGSALGAGGFGAGGPGAGGFGAGGLRVWTTEAAWTAGSSATGSFQGAVVPAPTLTRACEYSSGLGGIGARVRIYWRPPAGYPLADARVHASTSGLGSVLAPLTGYSLTSNTQALGDGNYRTEVPTNLLGGLLGLGSEIEIAIVMAPAAAGGWTSRPASVASNAGLIGGIGGNCRNLT